MTIKKGFAYCLTHDRGFYMEGHRNQAGPDCRVVGHGNHREAVFVWDASQQILVPLPETRDDTTSRRGQGEE